MPAQNLAAQKVLLKQKPSKHIRKWIARFYYFRHLYSAGSACVLTPHNNLHELPIDMGLSTIINILLGSFQLFLHSRSTSPLWGGVKLIPFSGVCQSGEAALSTPEAVVKTARPLTGAGTMCNRRPAATSSRRASFSALASANSSCILHRAQQHHADASACQ